MPSVEIIAVGTELLLGQLVDTNTAFIAARLAEEGIDVRATQAVGDNLERIAAAVRSALARSEGVITTGGLGPTVDDLTKEAVCAALGVDTELYEPALRQMEATFAAFGRPMRENNRKQAELPQGSRPLANPNGTAPGFIAFSNGGKFVASMPGVPREMKPMLVEQLLPFLRGRLGTGEAIYTRVLHTIGIGESEIDHRIGDLFRASENPKIAVLAHDYRADVKLMAKSASAEAAQAAIAPLQAEIEERLAGFVFGYDADSPASAVHAALRSRGLMLAVAESCTGGRIASALTGVPGSSQSFAGGIVAYANGASLRFGADVGLATTGIAGPAGGTPEKPVGLVWVGLEDADGATRATRLHLGGEREAVMQRATTAALGMLWRHLST